MTPAELRAKVAATRGRQGLGPVIIDPATLERVAAVLRLVPAGRPEPIAIDERCARDRDWFERHPWAREYRRAPHWSEIAELRTWGLVPDTGEAAGGRVTVAEVAPGVHVRRYGGVEVLSVMPR